MKINLDQSINHRLTMVSALARRLAYRTIAESGVNITPEQWTVLHYLWKEDGLSIGEIAAYSRKDFANVTRIVEKLIRENYVRKEKDKTDGRSYRIFLLPEGKSIRKTVEEIQQKVLTTSLTGINKQQQKMMLALLNRMEENIIEKLRVES